MPTISLLEYHPNTPPDIIRLLEANRTKTQSGRFLLKENQLCLTVGNITTFEVDRSCLGWVGHLTVSGKRYPALLLYKNNFSSRYGAVEKWIIPTEQIISIRQRSKQGRFLFLRRRAA